MYYKKRSFLTVLTKEGFFAKSINILEYKKQFSGILVLFERASDS